MLVRLHTITLPIHHLHSDFFLGAAIPIPWQRKGWFPCWMPPALNLPIKNPLISPRMEMCEHIMKKGSWKAHPDIQDVTYPTQMSCDQLNSSFTLFVSAEHKGTAGPQEPSPAHCFQRAPNIWRAGKDNQRTAEPWKQTWSCWTRGFWACPVLSHFKH